MVRRARMLGRPTLWLPGLDHASIAAQLVLDKILAAEGEPRDTLGRERYLERMREFVDGDPRGDAAARAPARRVARLGPAPVHDGRGLGPGRPNRVHPALPGGLAYRTEALINWCPGCRTAVRTSRSSRRRRRARSGRSATTSSTTTGQPDPDGRSRSRRPGPRRSSATRRWRSTRTTRATRPRRADRPHPVRRARRPGHRRPGGRARLRHRCGQDHPGPRPGRLRDRAAPRPADDHDPRRRRAGSTTPEGHTPASTATRRAGGSWRISRRAATSSRRSRTRWYRALPALRRRRRAAPQDAVVRPHQPLAEPALDGHPERPDPDLPERFVKVWEHWLTNIRDWNVGAPAVVGPPDPGLVLPRRPHHGERPMPADPTPARLRPAGGRADAGARHLRHLVQLAGCGRSPPWAGRTTPPTCARFYPGTVMETGLRHHLLLGRPDDDARHPSDGRRRRSRRSTCPAWSATRSGAKMWKTKGNVVDPLEIDRRDRRRCAPLRAGPRHAPGQRPAVRAEKLENARNFANKLWNAARFVLGARPASIAAERRAATPDAARLGPAERWLRSRVAATVAAWTRRWPTTRSARSPGAVRRRSGPSSATGVSSWPRSASRTSACPRPTARRPGGPSSRRSTRYLRLLHPFMPFVTEAIWAACRTPPTTRSC